MPTDIHIRYTGTGWEAFA